jgi:hypothetical protein
MKAYARLWRSLSALPIDADFSSWWFLGETVQTYLRGDIKHSALKFPADQTVAAAVVLKQ